MRITWPSVDAQVIEYPAGELQVRLNPALLPVFRVAETVTINARIQSPKDLLGLLLLTDAICNTEMANPRINLNIPYLPYGRADRRFVPGDCFGLGVFSAILRACNFRTITTLDGHNPAVATSLIQGLRNLSARPLIEKAIKDFGDHCGSELVTVLFPDDGAAKRYSLPVVIGPTSVQCLYAVKQRDPASGQFLGFTVPDIPPGPVMIVDDICDGGGTFTGIIRTILGDKAAPIDTRFALFVTHGIFSKGLDVILNGGFERVYTTDSFQQFAARRDLVVYDAFNLGGRC